MARTTLLRKHLAKGSIAETPWRRDRDHVTALRSGLVELQIATSISANRGDYSTSWFSSNFLALLYVKNCRLRIPSTQRQFGQTVERSLRRFNLDDAFLARQQRDIVVGEVGGKHSRL